jgi:nucleotide-binding universal stress UspA family protein
MSTREVDVRRSAGSAAQEALAPIRVLLATDGSECSGVARECLGSLPLPAGSAVHVVTVLDAESWQVPESLKGAEQEWARRTVREAEAELRREGVEMPHATPRGGSAYEILRAAEAFDADLVVLGSHGLTGIERFLLGSVATNVARHPGCPVLVARTPQVRRALLAVDLSEHAQQAVQFAAGLPLPPATELTVCHVVSPYYAYPPLGSEYGVELERILADVSRARRKEAAGMVDTALAALEEAGKRASPALREGDPAGKILELAAEEKADLIIAGARGVSPIHGLLVGRVADRLLKAAPCSVLLVHRDAHSKELKPGDPVRRPVQGRDLPFAPVPRPGNGGFSLWGQI